MRKTSLLAGAALLLGAYTATAAEDYTCATPPTCAELGYDQSVSDCSGKKTLKCPFDKTKVFCAGDCESEGYTLDSKLDNGFLSSVCCVGQTKVTCPYDSRYSKCTGECAELIDPGKRCVAAGYTLGGESVDGQLTIKFCLAGQTKVTCPYDSQYFKCEGEAAEFEPVLPKGCPAGEYSSEEACTKCQYGSLPGSKSGCYKCGTYSECDGFNGGKYCFQCNKVDKL